MATPIPAPTEGRRPPSLAVFKLASCDGCQLTLLDCENELLALTGRFRTAQFLEASSASSPGPYDISLVEGSVTTAADANRVRRIRADSRLLVTIGACATAGGIQALRNSADFGRYRRAVYPRPEYLDSLATSTPVSAHVPVDYELPGCPIDRGQLLELLTALLAGRRPRLPVHSVCHECKRRGITCLLVSSGTTCLGPITRAGCGAICPAYRRGCYGCFGPAAGANTDALVAHLRAGGADGAGLARLLSTFNAAAPVFAAAAARAEAGPSPAGDGAGP